VYYYGRGVEHDKEKGIFYWQNAAIQGHPEARHTLGNIEHHIGGHELAVQHYLISAKMGYIDSPDEIKEMFTKGLATKAQYAEALKGYQNALEGTKRQRAPSERKPRLNEIKHML